ncbi:MAG: hypothetical protein ACOH13_00095 [Flavobacteriales bacterium]
MEQQETRTAVVHRVSPDLVVCRYKPGAIVDAEAVAENLQARLGFPGSEPYGVVGIFPEDVEFDMSVLDKDHYKKTVLNDVTQVLALVAHGELFDTIARMYLAMHPTKFASQVFRMELDAFFWVNGRIQELREKHSSGNGNRALS